MCWCILFAGNYGDSVCKLVCCLFRSGTHEAAGLLGRVRLGDVAAGENSQLVRLLQRPGVLHVRALPDADRAGAGAGPDHVPLREEN